MMLAGQGLLVKGGAADADDADWPGAFGETRGS